MLNRVICNSFTIWLGHDHIPFRSDDKATNYKFLWRKNWILLEKTLFRANKWSCEFHRLDFVLQHWTTLGNRPASISILTSQIGQSNLFATHCYSISGNIIVSWFGVGLAYLYCSTSNQLWTSLCWNTI